MLAQLVITRVPLLACPDAAPDAAPVLELKLKPTRAR